MKANNLTNQRNDSPKSQIKESSDSKIDKMNNEPFTPPNDQELKIIVQRAFPLPSVSPSLTSSILDKINKMSPE